MEQRGFSRALADWLAMNLQPGDGGYHLGLDLEALRALLADYHARDLWSAALSAELPGEVHLVIAERSGALSQGDRARLDAAGPPVHVHRVDAGHWLHLEAGAAVVKLLVSQLAVA
jgi:pimeloyl-ACP methyl ester carboxylesterase